MALLFSVVESPNHPAFSSLYQRLALEEQRFSSPRKVITALKTIQPDFLVVEFIYAFSTYYQATNISNVDVLLSSLVKYSPKTRVIVLAQKSEQALAEKLNSIMPLHAILPMPVSEAAMVSALSELL